VVAQARNRARVAELFDSEVTWIGRLAVATVRLRYAGDVPHGGESARL
jgi:hypothetical protein